MLFPPPDKSSYLRDTTLDRVNRFGATYELAHLVDILAAIDRCFETPEFTSTPKGLTRAIAVSTFAGVKPPASTIGNR